MDMDKRKAPDYFGNSGQLVKRNISSPVFAGWVKETQKAERQLGGFGCLSTLYDFGYKLKTKFKGFFGKGIDKSSAWLASFLCAKWSGALG
ncbi:MAG: hypothetical protein KQI81_08785 [Deltaproteobacteria bacterium]|nr:hypothetical protein [Deltaproteobacteria bacterium]